MIITITSQADRRIVAGILLENGYTVEKVKVKEGKTNTTAIRAEKTEKKNESQERDR